MTDIWGVNNPGISGLDELTTAEEDFLNALVTLGDPNADRILFWDDSAGSYGHLAVDSSLTISGTTLSVTSAAFTNLTDFDTQTAWRIFYSDGSGDVTELALGANGTFLQSAGASAIPTWGTAGAGDVVKVGTPADNQIGVWTGDGTIEGTADVTWDGTSFNIATAKNFQIAGATVLADAAGTTTLSNIDALDATTEATIEAAIDTLANLVSVQGFTVTLADAGANAFFGWDDVAGAYENLTAAEAEAIIEPLIDTLANLTSIQGFTVTLADAGADAILGWDDSAAAYENLTQAEVLAVIGDSSATAKGVIELATDAETVTGTDTVRATTPANITAKMAAPGAIGGTTPAAITGTTITANTGFMPDANDGAYLGQAATAFSDLFLALGGVVNWNNGDMVLTHSAGVLTVSNTATGAAGPILELYQDSATPAANDVTSSINFYGEDSAGNKQLYGKISSIIQSPTSTSEGAYLDLITLGGTVERGVRIRNEWASGGEVAYIEPITSNLSVLGSTTKQWADLFLAEGGVINWDNGDLTLTQSGNSLTIAGGDFVLAENTSVQLDPALSADGTYTGITITGTAGAALAFGDLIYLAAADSRWKLADADAASTSGDVLLGMCVLAAGADGNATTILLQGNIRADAAFPALTISAPVYVGTTAGDVQTTAPSATDDVVRRVGFALTADSMYFNPSNDYITIV
jgi:hypothetical protein